ncbi:hypothetical protein ACFC8N_41120 [Streptomyces sp. NPDC055966]|uniref:hypothetical protein n=1 Tax=unclassified Streptomyces TaxID=2593676 RepID=UPI0035D89182
MPSRASEPWGFARGIVVEPDALLMDEPFGTSPLSTRQLLLVNLLTGMFPAMAVAATPPSPEPADEPTAADGQPVGYAVLGRPLNWQIRHRGLVTGIGGPSPG